MRSTWRTLLAALRPPHHARHRAGRAWPTCWSARPSARSPSAAGCPLWVPVLLSLRGLRGRRAVRGGRRRARRRQRGRGRRRRAGAQRAAAAVRLRGRRRAGGPLDAPGWSAPTLITDESAAFALRSEQHEQRRASFWVCGLALFVFWNLAVVAGALGGRLISDTDALGLDAAFPAVLLALVLPTLKGRATQAAAVVGAVVAIASTPYLPAGPAGPGRARRPRPHGCAKRVAADDRPRDPGAGRRHPRLPARRPAHAAPRAASPRVEALLSDAAVRAAGRAGRHVRADRRSGLRGLGAAGRGRGRRACWRCDARRSRSWSSPRRRPPRSCGWSASPSRPQSGSREIGQDMQRGPPRPEPSSEPEIATTSMPASSRRALVSMLRS